MGSACGGVTIGAAAVVAACDAPLRAGIHCEDPREADAVAFSLGDGVDAAISTEDSASRSAGNVDEQGAAGEGRGSKVVEEGGRTVQQPMNGASTGQKGSSNSATIFS